MGSEQAVPVSHAIARTVPLAIESIGYLVPQSRFTGHVHSVFEQNCNVACDHMLLTLCTPRAGKGPATLRLAGDPPRRLRDLFETGERVECRQGIVRTNRTEFCLMCASIWRPLEPRPLLEAERIDANLRLAGLHLAMRRATCMSVIDREGARATTALRNACRDLDREQAGRHAARLIGWGEGLTPAGDDFVVGLLAGLDALTLGDRRRVDFRKAFAARVRSYTPRTTPIGAHCLHLASEGHYSEPLCTVRNALLCHMPREIVSAAIDSVLSIGATSGADMMSGILAGLGAWIPQRSCAATDRP